MRSPWKPVNKRLRNKIPGLGGGGGIELWNVRGCNWYWIHGMNPNCSNYARGGFYSRVSDACESGEYVVDLRAGLIAKTADLGYAAA